MAIDERRRLSSTLGVNIVNISLSALKVTGGSYVINGDWSVSSSRQYDAAGSIVRYYRPPAGAVHNNKEYIYIEGPTTVSLDVLVCTDFQGKISRHVDITT